MSFRKAEVRLKKTTVCTKAQNVVKFKEIFNGNAKKPQTSGTRHLTSKFLV